MRWASAMRRHLPPFSIAITQGAPGPTSPSPSVPLLSLTWSVFQQVECRLCRSDEAPETLISVRPQSSLEPANFGAKQSNEHQELCSLIICCEFSCKFGCAFCASTSLDFLRNYLFFRHHVADDGRRCPAPVPSVDLGSGSWGLCPQTPAPAEGTCPCHRMPCLHLG